MKIIKAQQKAGFWLLLLVWLFVVAIPAALLRRALNCFLDVRLEQSIPRVRPFLYSELQQFISDLDGSIWLEEKLKDFDLQNIFVNLQSGRKKEFYDNVGELSAESIHQKLEKHLGFPVLAVFAHGNDTSNVSAFLRTVSGLP